MTQLNSCASEAGRRVLVTGGAGFIGSNLVARLIQEDNVRVRILDNLARHRVRENLEWLDSLPQGNKIEFCEGDVKDLDTVTRSMEGISDVFHLAAQVSVTGSIMEPIKDFETNAKGTLNVLEAARSSGRRPFVLFTSTNKVYGSLDRLTLTCNDRRYLPEDASFEGVTEVQELDFHSPYGCSKGAADQYVRDYARIYGLPTVVFRMSCIAGPRQFGSEDQGWVAHFVFSILNRQPITLFGNGLQVRDTLFIDDLVDAMIAARVAIDRTNGQVYNVGGGPQRAASLIEMISVISREVGIEARIVFRDVRPGDQRLYISNTGKLTRDTGWVPSRSVYEIVRSLELFWREHYSR